MSEYALEITGLKKVYNNDVEALKGIDLKITKGDFFALLGPNGAGKSSTIEPSSIIAMLLQCCSASSR